MAYNLEPYVNNNRKKTNGEWGIYLDMLPKFFNYDMEYFTFGLVRYVHKYCFSLIVRC